MLSTYDFNVSAATLVEGFSHTRTYRINAQDRDRARQKMWKVVHTQTPRLEYARINWERWRSTYSEPQSIGDLEVRQALRSRYDTSVGDSGPRPCPAFIYDFVVFDLLDGSSSNRIQVRHTCGRKSDQYLTWDEFTTLWTTVPGYYI